MNTRNDETWPPLPLGEWRDTCATLHLWTQVVGKVRLVQTPWLNHSWHVPLYVTARGLTTSPIPYAHRTFVIEFDFIEHRLRIDSSDGAQRQLSLQPQSVADFHSAVMRALADIGIEIAIDRMPNEIPGAIPFDEDREHASYDAIHVHRFWRILVQADRVLKTFRTGFVGKSSPVHFFWGSFDLAATRFSGRRAPLHPGGVPNLADAVVREAYSHEVSSVGFWPGGGTVDFPAFYAYAYPEPAGFREASVRPDDAFFSTELGEFILPYDAVRGAATPDQRLLEFAQSTYDAAADLGHWDRAALECGPGTPGTPRTVA
ncbi:MAG: DUF5996 family protein [Betaproteobacteria bacterium]